MVKLTLRCHNIAMVGMNNIKDLLNDAEETSAFAEIMKWSLCTEESMI